MKLQDLAPGDKVLVQRDDGPTSVATFEMVEDSVAVLSLDGTEYHGGPNRFYLDQESAIKPIVLFKVV